MGSNECFDFMVLTLSYKTLKFSVLNLLSITTPLLTGSFHFFFDLFFSLQKKLCVS